MRLHRFYVHADEIELRHNFWVHDAALLHQWNKVLRFAPGQEVVLFDGTTHDRLYKIVELSQTEAHLQHVTDLERKTPSKEVYLFWSLLKKDKNDWVLQKCAELGVSHFVPLLANRSEKTGFNLERAQKILIEAAEQCGRSDIPAVREPMNLQTAVADYKGNVTLLACEQSNESQEPQQTAEGPVGVFVGPEGGWSDDEKAIFDKDGIHSLNLHDFTLRAETACVAAVTILSSQ